MRKLIRPWRMFGLLLLACSLNLVTSCKKGEETDETEDAAAEQNVCQRASAHMIGCMTAFCEANADNPFCGNLDDIRAEAASVDEAECFDDDATQALEITEMSCDDIEAMLGLTAPAVPDPVVPPVPEPTTAPAPPAAPAAPTTAPTPPPG